MIGSVFIFVMTIAGRVVAERDVQTRDIVPEVLVKVNGRAIYRHELDHALARILALNPQGRDGKTSSAAQRADARARRRKALDELIDEHLLYEEAQRLGLSVSETRIEAQWKMARRQIDRGGAPNDSTEEKLSKSGFTKDDYKDGIRRNILARMVRRKLIPERDTISDKEIEACYKKFKERFRVPPKVHFRELLVALPSFAGKDAVSAAEKRMKTIERKLDTGVGFETLVREYSDAASAKNGGDSGWKTRSDLGDEAANLAFSLEPGEIGGPLRTTTGLVLIELIEKRSTAYHTVGEARDNIVDFLRQEKGNANVKDLLNKLRDTAEIEHVVRP